MTRSSFFTSLLALAALAVAAPLAAAGCAAPTDEESEEQLAESEEAISAAASQLVGGYWTRNPAFGGFARLTLKADGKYTASVDPAGTALCVTSPCVLPESGTWNATKKAGGGFRLRIRAAGAASRYYVAAKSGDSLTLTRAGKTETLRALGTNACLDDADCSTGQECGPKVCLMYCHVDDPFCCGPSTCRPKAPPPPPPPACWGAWLDENGTCRTPADGVYPASCCDDLPKGEPCGPTTCGAGTVCCNPLAGICTKPGMFCHM